MESFSKILLMLLVTLIPRVGAGGGDWEITSASEQAVERGLEWLARNQGPAGNWDSNDLGIVSYGALAFMAAGHLPDRGKYGSHVRRALDFVLQNAKPSGLLNSAEGRRDMYNHGMAVFVLSQAYGMTTDKRLGKGLDLGIKLILDVQCDDGGWAYEAIRKGRGNDLSIAVMQAKALRSAMDIGLDIPDESIERSLQFIRARYKPYGEADGIRYGNDPLSERPGAFTYNGNKATVAMAAAGAVCMQEFGKYDDFRILRSVDKVIGDIEGEMKEKLNPGNIPFDAYAMNYVAQALYQVGGQRWRDNYPKVRDAIIEMQAKGGGNATDGSWGANGHLSGKVGQCYGTSVAVFALSIPNRYLPILQEGEAKISKRRSK